MRRALRSLAAVAGIFLHGGLARSAEPVELEWEAPPGCSSQQRVLAEIARLVSAHPTEPLIARARVTPHAGGFRVVIEIQGGAEGTRTLQAASCDSVARATALIIALAIDPQAAAVVSQDAEPRAPARETSPDATETAPAQDALETRTEYPASAVDPLLFVGALVEQALAPNVAPGIELGGGIAWRFLRSDLTASIVPSAVAKLDDRPDVQGRFTLAALRLRACGGSAGTRLALYGCAAVRATRIWARGRGATPSFDEAAFLGSLEPGVLLRVPGANGFAAEVAAALVVPMNRPSFVIAQGTRTLELFRPGPVGATASASLGYRF